MSLLKFLSAGKSLVGLKDFTTRYRMGHPGSMPKFGSGKNPFLAKSERAQTAISHGVQARPAVESSSPAVTEPCEAIPTTPLVAETAAVDAPAVEPMPVASPASKKFAARSFLSVVSRPLDFLRRKSPAKARRQSRRQLRPVQTELSLDCVKVLRNDLSDADLEVVSAKRLPASQAKVESAAQRSGASKHKPIETVETAPDRASEHLAGATKP
jgi:hypothetical protein